jgi:hypothetical protein
MGRGRGFIYIGLEGRGLPQIRVCFTGAAAEDESFIIFTGRG